MLVQLVRGVFDTRTGVRVADCGTGQCRKHPWGFHDGIRINGFYKALREGEISLTEGTWGDLACGCCQGTVGQQVWFPLAPGQPEASGKRRIRWPGIPQD